MKTSSTDFPVFVRNLMYLTIILAVAAFAVRYFLPENAKTPALPYLLLFFFSVTLLVHYILLKSAGKKLSKFINLFLVSTFLKLLFYLIVFVLYVFTHRSDAIPFTATFLILYFAFAIFETLSLLGKTNNPA